MKHTPGPWTVDRAWHIDKGFLRIIRDPRLERVAMIPDVERELDEALADAHLIAAAPDLLAALRPFANLIENPDEWPDGLHQWFVDTDDIRRAIAAIAKATGEAA